MTSKQPAGQIDFAEGSVRRKTLALAAPMLVAQMLNLLYNIVDRIYIGKIPGEGMIALAGLGLCFPVITMVTAFANLFGLVGALLQVYPNTTFTEMFCPDWEQDVILLSHMGESNPKLAQWKPLISDCPFNYNSCGDTTAMYNCLRKGKAVYVNLAPMQDHFTLIVSGVEMLDEGLERGAYRHSTQGWMKPCKPLPQFLKEFSLAGGTHHSALVYDANIEEIKAFGTMMGFEVIEIK